jgi:hypothetical protein
MTREGRRHRQALARRYHGGQRQVVPLERQHQGALLPGRVETQSFILNLTLVPPLKSAIFIFSLEVLGNA